MWGMWVGILVLAAGCVMIVEVGRRSLAGTLPRNDLVGLRTRATLVDDEAWLLGHRAAGGSLIRGGVAGLAICALGSATARMDRPGITAALLMAAVVALLAATLVACVQADRTARRHLASKD